MNKKIKNLLVSIGIIKPYTTYKGIKVTPFKYNREVFFFEYVRIINKVSLLGARKRNFVVYEVEKWLKENNINVIDFKNEHRN